MAHDVFVSYPSREKPTADAAVMALESAGIRCWIAPRDVPAGADWAGSIVEAIEQARLLGGQFPTPTAGQSGAGVGLDSVGKWPTPG